MSNSLKVMYFSAPWCGPCKVFKPVLKEVMKGFPDVEFQKVDADNESQLLTDHAVRSIPTTIMFKDGKEIFRRVSIIDKKTLVDFINSNK